MGRPPSHPESRREVQRGPIRIMYHAPLVAGRTHAAFRERWTQHGELAMGLPMWRHMTRYQQFDALSRPGHNVPAEFEQAQLATAHFGGVGSAWIRDLQGWTAVRNDPDGAVLRRDEVETFGRELGPSLVSCRPETVIAPTAEATVFLFGTVFRQPSLVRAEFAKLWRDHGRLFAADKAVARHIGHYVQNHALPEGEGADGFVELGFTSLESLAAFVTEPALEALAASEAEFLRPEALDLLVCHERRLFQ
jgi:hypothetical protein